MYRKKKLLHGQKKSRNENKNPGDFIRSEKQRREFVRRCFFGKYHMVFRTMF